MGTIIFYVMFIAGASTIAKLIWALNRRGVVFNWNPFCATAFDYFKEALISKTILKIPFWEKIFGMLPTLVAPVLTPL